MLRLILAALALGLAGPLTAADPATHQVKLNGQIFTLPRGFEIELVAGPPLTKRPIAAAFDDTGVLYVTEASGTNDPVKKQVVDLPHTVLRLVDKDGDGKFDTSNVYADRLMLPQGIMVRGGSVYVGHPPVITKFTDADGDGRAEKRENWFDGKTLTGCANDLHGPYPGPDGWIYWTKGAFAKQEYVLPNGKKFTTRASHIFRARPDGTGVEPVMTGGMDNPVDVVFTPGGERIFTTTFFQRPADGKRDGLIHAVYGGVYGKDHDPVYEHPWTGPELMPVMTHLGAAAPCGLHRLESDQFGPEFTDNLFACCFNMHKVTRHVLVPDGATFKTVDSDFLVSDSLDFHPTDVIEDADGSLIVVDTGGWYKLCCPTSQLVKPDVLGAIYRVRKTGSHKLEDPRGLKFDWPKLTVLELANLLGDSRPAVRQRAIETLGARPAEALPVVERLFRESKTVEVRRNCLWTASRFNLSPVRTVHSTPDGPHTLLTCVNLARAALDDPDASVRHVALHLVSLYRDRGAATDVIKLLKNPSLHNRRAAAEALGRIGDKSTVPTLLAAHKGVKDRVLQHSLTYALIEIGDSATTAAGLKDPDPPVRRAALVALDQMPGDGLTADAVLAELPPIPIPLADVARYDPSVVSATWWIIRRRPAWATALVPALRERLSKPIGRLEHDLLVTRLADLSANPEVQQLIADVARGKGVTDPAASQVALQAMARSGLKTIPSVWVDALESALTKGNAPHAILAIRSFPAGKNFPPKLADALRRVGESDAATGVTLAALSAIPGGLQEVSPRLFEFLVGRFGRNEDRPSYIPEAADILGKARLKPDQLVTLAKSLKAVGPTERTKLLDAFSRSADERAGQALIAVLLDPGVRSSIRTESVKPVLDKYPPKVREAATKLYAALDADRAGERAKLESLLAGIKNGDVRRGQAVFNSTKAACITCHQMGYLGGKVGPDLTRIGGVRTERDLLEAVVFPSASFVRSYEPVKVTTLDGRVFQGILKVDAPDEVVLTINATEEARIARADIDELTPGTVSVMPSGLDQQLSPQDLADLIAFLKASK
jgi:putative membrane-bound dehydrogenase-like protein